MAQRKKDPKPARAARARSAAGASKAALATPSAQARLQECMAKFDAAQQAAIRAVRTGMRKRLPAANELLYDYGSFFVLAYATTEHPKDAVASIAARPDGLRLYLLHGPRLPDPQKLLRGAGSLVRYVVLERPGMLASSGVEALLAAAIAIAGIDMQKSQRGKLVDRTPGQKKRTDRRRTP